MAAKIKIVYFKVYLGIRELLNLTLWIAMMVTAVPEIQKESYEHLFISGALGFAIFSAVIARCNRCSFAAGAGSTDGSPQQNTKKRVKNHALLKFFYFPIAIMLAAVAAAKAGSTEYNADTLGQLGSAFGYILGILIILINIFLIYAFVVIYKNKQNLFRSAAITLVILSLLLLLTMVIGFCLSFYALAVYSSVKTWTTAETIMTVLVCEELIESIIDPLMNCLAIETRQSGKAPSAYM